MLEVFRLEFGYLVIGWGGLVLIGLGLLAFVPVALTTGSDPAGRFYPRRRNNWLGWGMSFYLMGLALVLQLAAIAAN